ncbi:MAG: sigma-70 family RNA polymerase sigma factor [Dysgonamonadaceae bacterium]|jgi:RNA polymerase sigma-70 factor (ECF subfamily)|nr:sigma-70 family RNA polymerase sigma factor [Dysgonamonadaceae bacterium]
MITDNEILERFEVDKESGFKLLFAAYYVPLCLYSVQITDSFEQAKDIVQDLFIVFWEKKLYQSIKTNLHNYLYSSVRHSSHAFLQKNKFIPIQEIEEIIHFPMEEIQDMEDLEEQKRRLHEELKKLSVQEYKVVNAIIIHRKKYKEVAEEMGISVNTVKTYLSRALKQLRDSSPKLTLLLLLGF